MRVKSPRLRMGRRAATIAVGAARLVSFPISDVYLVDLRSGFLTPLAATGYAYSHGLASVSR